MRKLLIASVIGCMTASSFAVTTQPKQETPQFNTNQTQQIEKIVKNYLLKNPKILIEMSQALKQQRQADKVAQYNKSLDIIKKNKEDIFNKNISPVIGNKNGAITIMEFYDYQCGHCKRAATNIKQLLKENKDLKVVLKDLPIFKGNSLLAAKATLAAYKIDPKNYFKFHAALMNINGPLNNENIMKIAKELKYNIKELEGIMHSSDLREEINQNFALAKSIQLTGTPAYIIANKNLSKIQFLPGGVPINYLQNIINTMRSN